MLPDGALCTRRALKLACRPLVKVEATCMDRRIIGIGSGEDGVVPSPWFSVFFTTPWPILPGGIGPSGGGFDSGARSTGVITTPACSTFGSERRDATAGRPVREPSLVKP